MGLLESEEEARKVANSFVPGYDIQNYGVVVKRFGLLTIGSTRIIGSASGFIGVVDF